MKSYNLPDTGILGRYLEDLKKQDLAEVPESVVDSYFYNWLLLECEDPFSLLEMKREAIVCVNKYRNIAHELEIL